MRSGIVSSESASVVDCCVGDGQQLHRQPTGQQCLRLIEQTAKVDQGHHNILLLLSETKGDNGKQQANKTKSSRCFFSEEQKSGEEDGRRDAGGRASHVPTTTKKQQKKQNKANIRATTDGREVGIASGENSLDVGTGFTFWNSYGGGSTEDSWPLSLYLPPTSAADTSARICCGLLFAFMRIRSECPHPWFIYAYSLRHRPSYLCPKGSFR